MCRLIAWARRQAWEGYYLPHARVMIHQPWGGAQGTASDISIHAKEILKLKDDLNHILAKHTGQPLERVEKDSDRDFFMSSGEAKSYGIVDQVIESKSDIPDAKK